jgi:hypothetical protein
MKITQPIPNTLLFEFNTQRELVMTMFRIQEFYESPFENIKNKYFTVEEFIQTHMSDSGEIDYFNKWTGFNIPGHIIKNFFFVFRFNLTKEEIRLKEEVEKKLDLSKPFYIIASLMEDKRVITHEVAHALYYLNKDYKKKMLNLTLALSEDIHNSMERALLDLGYCEEVINDEIQACLSTGSVEDLKWLFKFKIKEIKPMILPFNKIFLDYTTKKLQSIK